MPEHFEFPWERSAMRGEEMPDGLSLADQMAYTAVRNIYLSYDRRYITRETASEEKQKIRLSYERCQKKEAVQRELALFQAKRIRMTEGAVCACRKDPTPENAVRLCNILDGMER